MTRKQKNDLTYILNAFIIIAGLYFIFKYSLNIFYIFILVILSIIISGSIAMIIPSKKNKRKSNKKTKFKTEKEHKKQLNIKVRSHKELLKTPLNKLNWKEFEELCYLYYKDKGMQPIRTKNGADGGVDLIVIDPKYKEKTAIQIKHWKNKVTVDEIRNLNSAKWNHDCILAEFITSGEYTNKAIEEAEKFKINAFTAGHILNWRENKLKRDTVKS